MSMHEKQLTVTLFQSDSSEWIILYILLYQRTLTIYHKYIHYVCTYVYVYDDIYCFTCRFLGNRVLRHVSLKGVADAFDKHGDKEHKGIKAHFRMDESGILHLDDVR